MQATHQTQERQATALAFGSTSVANGPMPLAVEMLKFVGGGKGVSTTTITPSSPKSGW
jgi:hypothetical protein